MRVHHLNTATLCPPGGRRLGGSGGVLSSGRLVCHCLLLETEAGLVLVDTGIGERTIASPSSLGRGFLALVRPTLRVEETALSQVKKLGHSPADVRHIIVTHLDPDHAGALSDFPEARVHVYDVEYRAASSPSLTEKPRYRAELWAHGARFTSHALAGDRWMGFDAVRQPEGLPPEILIVPLTGHTRGHAGIAVDTGKRWLLHAGDAYFSRDEVYGDGKATPVLEAFQYIDAFDNRQRLENRARLRKLALEHPEDVRVFSAHDARELEALQAE
jgi:glyoxylase-like metal-dependent hydrolase (beta-lactamase superfamily II)